MKGIEETFVRCEVIQTPNVSLEESMKILRQCTLS